MANGLGLAIRREEVAASRKPQCLSLLPSSGMDENEFRERRDNDFRIHIFITATSLIIFIVMAVLGKVSFSI